MSELQTTGNRGSLRQSSQVSEIRKSIVKNGDDVMLFQKHYRITTVLNINLLENSHGTNMSPAPISRSFDTDTMVKSML